MPLAINYGYDIASKAAQTYGAFKGAGQPQKPAEPKPEKKDAAAPEGGFQNWLNTQSNTTLAIGGLATLGLILAVTR